MNRYILSTSFFALVGLMAFGANAYSQEEKVPAHFDQFPRHDQCVIQVPTRTCSEDTRNCVDEIATHSYGWVGCVHYWAEEDKNPSYCRLFETDFPEGAFDSCLRVSTGSRGKAWHSLSIVFGFIFTLTKKLWFFTGLICAILLIILVPPKSIVGDKKTELHKKVFLCSLVIALATASLSFIDSWKRSYVLEGNLGVFSLLFLYPILSFTASQFLRKRGIIILTVLNVMATILFFVIAVASIT